jgi:hypothetical protein
MHDSVKWHHDYYLAHKQERDVYNQQYRRTHLAEFNVRNARYRERLRNQAFEKLGNQCANPQCRWVNEDGTQGCTDQRCLQIDHVLDDGYKERHLAMVVIYRKVLLDSEGRYQLLCANCNWLKLRNYIERKKTTDVSGN